jgi:hypothetical protein
LELADVVDALALFAAEAVELEDEAFDEPFDEPFDEALFDAPVVVPQPATSEVRAPIASIDITVRLACRFKILPPLLYLT